MTGIGKKALAQPVKPPLRERCACLAKLVKNRLTLTEGDETYACLLTVPGIGPRTAAQLAVSVDIGRFPDHDHLASYCGIAPRVRSSGTSVRSVRASRRGDARLKSLLIFSCNSLVRSSGRYGEYYRACRTRGMGHGRALKAVARKRIRAIYAVMRDRVPYRE